MAKINRRDFVIKSTAASALTFGFYVPDSLAKVGQKILGQAANFMPNAFVSITPDNKVTVFVKHLEMGQGVYTGVPSILAEELEVDPSKISVEAAPADAKLYNNLFWGPMQGTGGSTSMANSFAQLSQAGAAARETLKEAAAKKWQTSVKNLKAQDGRIHHTKSKKSLAYGDLVSTAKGLKPPKDIPLKSKKNYKVIGKFETRLDGREKSDGRAIFAIDVRQPNRLVALVARPPQFGGKVQSVDDSGAKKVKGYRSFHKIPSGVAVIADSYWSAQKARKALGIKWQPTKHNYSHKDIEEQYREFAKKPGLKVNAKGKATIKDLKKGGTFVEADYWVPYLAHAPMEPLNCTIQKKGSTVEVWSGSQSQTGDQMATAKILGVPIENVKVHTTLAGGSFGRRATPAADLVSEAALILKVSGITNPIHLMWSREDDIKGGMYRPAFYHKVAVSVNKKGTITGWNQRIVGQSILEGTPFASMIKNGIDHASVEGVSNLAYDVDNFYCDLHSPKSNIPVLWWRSVGHTHTALAVESTIDQAAAAIGMDPMEFRLANLSKQPRHKAILQELKKRAKWNQRQKKAGKGYGLAVHKSFGSFVAQMVEVTVKGGKPKVDRVVCVADCGLAINPDIVKTQIEGSIGFALSAALRQEITFAKGEVQQSNFHDFPLARMTDMPPVDIYFVEGDSKPSGIGEPGVPPFFPAFLNAIYDATGKRVDRLPINA